MSEWENRRGHATYTRGYKKCPLCGGKSAMSLSFDYNCAAKKYYGGSIHCTKRYCSVSCNYMESKKSAKEKLIAAWNRRVVEEKQKERIAEIEKENETLRREVSRLSILTQHNGTRGYRITDYPYVPVTIS